MLYLHTGKYLSFYLTIILSSSAFQFSVIRLFRMILITCSLQRPSLYIIKLYSVIPLDFTGFDPWIMFMRWTHLPSAYTPLWISLTIPLYLLSFGVFSVLFLQGNFFSPVLSCIAIYLQSQKVSYPENSRRFAPNSGYHRIAHQSSQ